MDNQYRSKENPIIREKEKSSLENIKYDLETIKSNKFLYLKNKQYNFTERDCETVILSLKIGINFIKCCKLYCRINEINKNEYYIDYHLNNSNFLIWLNNVLKNHYYNSRVCTCSQEHIRNCNSKCCAKFRRK